MSTEKQAFGSWGETTAAEFIKNKGYKVVDRNYRVKRGELDIVAWHKKERFGDTLCFIEIKTRRGEKGSAERATDAQKLKRMCSAARHWCLSHDIRTDSTPIQFEQISIYKQNESVPIDIFHYVIPPDSLEI